MPLLNQRHESFAQLIASGESGAAAYRTCYGTDGASAEAAASRLLRNGKVQKRVLEMQGEAAKAAVLTLEERRLFLAAVVRGEHADAKMPDKLRAAELDAKLAGDIRDGLDVSLRRQTQHEQIHVHIPLAIAEPRIPPRRNGETAPSDAQR